MTPPRIATWLLVSLGCDPNNEALVGDLIEQYQACRSRMWYRGQVLRAVIVGVWAHLRERPFLSFGSIISGPALAALLAALLQRVLLPYAVIGPLSYRTFSVVLWAACLASIHLTASVSRFFQRQGRNGRIALPTGNLVVGSLKQLHLTFDNKPTLSSQADCLTEVY